MQQQQQQQQCCSDSATASATDSTAQQQQQQQQQQLCALKVIDKKAFFDRVAEGKERIDTLVREALSQAVLTAQWACDCQQQQQLQQQQQQQQLTACNTPDCTSTADTTTIASSSTTAASSSATTAGECSSSNSSTATAAVTAAAVAVTACGSCPIVRLRGLFETAEHLVLEMELMSGTDLFDKLSSSGVLRDADAAGLVRNVLRAAAFCARRGMAHRDIKLANLIYPTAHTSRSSSSSSSSNSVVSPSDVRLADFGMVGICDAQGLLHGRCGTPGYVAPEILHAAVHEGYPSNVDSFSVGVVAYTVLCGFEVIHAIS
jgi:serine/threonine protein kinase